VPVLEDGDLLLTQSMAILEYLEERYPDPPLLPRHPVERARVRALAQFIACEIHPLNNLRVLNHIRRAYGLDGSQVRAWYRHWIEQGFAPLEAELARTAGRYAYGDKVSMADVLLVPQVLNARRYDCELDAFPILRDVERNCLELPAFDRPPPEPDADAS
jgi:maleylacetoacetate isomerase